jgi:hypothetical protein
VHFLFKNTGKSNARLLDRHNIRGLVSAKLG